MKIFLFPLLVLCAFRAAFAQCIPVTATVPTQVCLNEKFDLAATSTATLFTWDLCPNNLYLDPVIKKLDTGPTVARAQDITTVKSDDNYFLFTVHDNFDKITRLKLGSDLRNNAPEVTDLGNPGNLLARPLSIEVFEFHDVWYAIVLNVTDRRLILLDFGSSLESQPAASVLYNSIGDANSSVAVVANEDELYVLVAESSKIKILTFLSDLATPPSFREVNTTISLAIDLKTIKYCNTWYAFVLDYNAKRLVRIKFDATLTSETITQLTTAIPLADPYRFWIGREGARFHAFVTNIGSGMVRVDLDGDIEANSPTITNSSVINGSTIPNGWTVTLNQSGGHYCGFAVNGVGGGEVYRFDFPDPCGFDQSQQSGAALGPLSLSTAGNFEIALTAQHDDGTFNSAGFSFTVTTDQAPDITIASENNCANHSVFFTHQGDSQNIESFDWDFGDGSPHSIDQAPVKIYNNGGSYNAKLVVAASNGCSNNATLNVKIYEVPVALFQVPQGNICTNNEFTFVNNTSDSYNGLLSFEWRVGGNAVGTNKDLKYTFEAPGSYQVSLEASIPGCSSVKTETMSDVQSGPIVSFDFLGKCQHETVTFSNNSSGQIAGYLWNFGNGAGSTVASPGISYPTPGIYTITLNTIGVNNCISSLSKELHIYAKPVPSFSLDLPPFSCSGTPSQFHDLTPVPDDSNLESWNWNFGPGATKNEKNPTHTYASAGEYNVSLTVTTDQGCSASAEQLVTISQSPTTDFSFDTSCVNQAVNFNDGSLGELVAWQWTVENSVYTSQNVSHVFLSPGLYSVGFRVTEANGCLGTTSKDILIPDVPSTIDFSVANTCVGQSAIFADRSVSQEDPIALTEWTFTTDNQKIGSQVSHEFQESGIFPVRLSITTESGCRYEIVRNVTVYSAPSADFSMSVEDGPAPLQIDFQNESTGAVMYQWLSNGAVVSTVENPAVVFSALGDYVVDLVATNEFGCKDEISKQVHVITPRTDLSLVQFQLVEDPGSGDRRNQLTIANASNYTIRKFDVVLDLGNGTSIRETQNREIKAGETSTLLLSNALQTVSSGFVCAELVLPDDLTPNDNRLCIPLAEQPILLTPSPNPANTSFSVELIAPAPTTARIRIVNGLGEQVSQWEVEAVKGANEFTFDIANLQSGIYFLKLEADTQQFVYRLFVQ